MKKTVFGFFCLQVLGASLLYWSIHTDSFTGVFMGLGAVFGSAACSLFK